MNNSIYKKDDVFIMRILKNNEILNVAGGEWCTCFCENAGYGSKVSSAEKCEIFCASVDDSMECCVVFDKDKTHVAKTYYRIGQPADKVQRISSVLKLGSGTIK